VAKLVLTLMEFLRKLFEKQTLRRMDEQSLTAEETEAIGLALMWLEETITDLAGRFGLSVDELSLTGSSTLSGRRGPLRVGGRDGASYAARRV
jgi:hypothetical protein